MRKSLDAHRQSRKEVKAEGPAVQLAALCADCQAKRPYLDADPSSLAQRPAQFRLPSTSRLHRATELSRLDSLGNDARQLPRAQFRTLTAGLDRFNDAA
jgi:hypothetical protein